MAIKFSCAVPYCMLSRTLIPKADIEADAGVGIGVLKRFIIS
jgi:hypothetical protein